MGNNWHKPDPDKDGKIPCDCCNNGYRKNMYTKVKYVCNHCNGTQSRVAPPHYVPSSQEIPEEVIEMITITLEEYNKLKEQEDEV